ncbi:MAG: sugar phosphate isomerase/epimerase family protein [Desulfobacterales bacterium]
MIFGYSTNAFVKFNLFEAVEKIADLGFGGVEIMGDRPHLYPPDFDEKKLARLKELLERHHLAITNINSFTLFAVGDTYLPSWIEADPQRREIRVRHTLDSLKVAHFLGCGNISVPPGGPLTDGTSRQAAAALFHEGLERVIPLAEELGINILIEPEPDLLMENTAEFKSFIKDVASKAVGLNFDIGHFYCAGEDPAAAFIDLFEWIGHVHIEDIAPSRRHHHLIAGHGAIGFSDVFDTMKRLGYDGDISLELYPYVNTPTEAGRESLAYLKPIMARSGLNIG